MKNLFMSMFAAGLLCALSLAQTAPSGGEAPQTQPSQSATQSTSQPANTPANNADNLKIAPGSVIPVQLTKGVDAKKAKTGDEIDARVTQDLKSNSGALLVPKDTKVVGHVTEAQARTKDQKESQVAITFDHAVLKDGHDVSLPLSIQAIISPEALNPNNGNSAGNAPPPSGSDSAGSPSSGAGRTAAGGGGMSQPRPSAPSAGGDTTAAGGTNSQPQITANTKGVVGISGMTLSDGQTNQGSIVTSEKNNVKLENGTLMLLRVNQ